MKTYPVTIIIPAFNAENFIAETVHSAISARPNRIIVVDDGSEDDTNNIVRQIQESVDNIDLVFQENLGESSAINHGLRLSKTEFVLILSADDLIAERLLERAMEVFSQESNCMAVYPSYSEITSDGSIISKVTNIDFSIERLVGELICLPGPGSVIRTRVLSQGRDLRMRQLGDLDQWIRICTKGKFIHLQEVLASWRQHEHNMSHNSYGAQMSFELDLIDQSVVKLLETHSFLDKTSLSLSYRFNWYRRKAIAEVRVAKSFRSPTLAIRSIKLLIANKELFNSNHWTIQEFLASLFPNLARLWIKYVAGFRASR